MKDARHIGKIILGLCVVATFGAMFAVAGCYNLGGDCKITLTDCGSGGTGGGGIGGAAGTGGSAGTAGSGPGGAPPECVPSNNTSPVEESCGIFVSSSLGDDSFDGSKKTPFATITKALYAAAGKPIYLCGEPFLEIVTAAEHGFLYGGLDCSTNWGYDAAQRTLLSAPADAITLSVLGKTRIEVYDVDISAENAMKQGGSAIAILADGEADVSLSRSNVFAGDGAPGPSGEAHSGRAVEGMPGGEGNEACSASQVNAPQPPVNDCDGVQSIGGAGGNGLSAFGADGSDGSNEQPDGTENGGKGETNVMQCTPGTAGDPGTAGEPGPGGTALGVLQADLGYVGASGEGGKPGAPGQGGGGGGGAKGGTGPGKCMMADTAGGASGGTGGSGGCGGLGGRPGLSGGSSIAIMSLGAKLSFLEVVIETRSGGPGGDGGDGQTGGQGGPGRPGGNTGNHGMLKSGCSSGSGGPGGKGGKGGGGRGGHSIGIAYTGDAPAMDGVTFTIGQAAVGGAGDGDTGKGAAGLATETQSFD
jgi:hypothetical protein